MKYRALTQANEGGFDAWSPDLPGCAARGSTEAEALLNLRYAIEGSLDLTRQMRTSKESAVEHFLEVEGPEERHHRVEVEAAQPPPPLAPVSGWTQIVIGGTMILAALAGIGFYFQAEVLSTPALLFAPFVLLAIGFALLLFGVLTLQSPRTSK